jgi:glyoxylase-like metal-dependent hydrolase (beta-lactamase superfamily II)
MKLTPRCHAVLGLACIPPWTVNAGLVAGDTRTLIVDTGYGAATARTLIGYAEALRPGNELVAVVTEPHLDHILGIGTLRERGIEVYGHAGVARRPEDLEAEISEYAECVTDPARRVRGEARRPFTGTRVERPSRPLTGETALDLGGVEARLLFTPGHTLANLCVHVPTEGVLFSGDTLVEGYLPNLEAGGVAEWRSWLTSLDRIAALALAVVVPGHGAPLVGGEVTAAIDRVRRTLDEALRTGRPPTGPRARS